MRDGLRKDGPLDVELAPEPCSASFDAPADMPVDAPVSVEPSRPRRTAACSELCSMTEDLITLEPPPVVHTPDALSPAPHMEPHTLCTQRRYLHLDSRSRVNGGSNRTQTRAA